jgi:hypothetical protein
MLPPRWRKAGERCDAETRILYAVRGLLSPFASPLVIGGALRAIYDLLLLIVFLSQKPLEEANAG